MCGGPGLDQPGPAEVEAIKTVARYLRRERRFWGEMYGWLSFCEAATQYLGRTTRDGDDTAPEVRKFMEMAVFAGKRSLKAADLLLLMAEPT